MRCLGLDLGDQRIGVAVSDAAGIVARPVEVFNRSSRANDFAHIDGLARSLQAETLVVGLPLNMDGTEGQQATWVRDYCEELSQVVASTIVLWDERLSTAEAREILKAQGRSGDGNPVDAVAAAVILQSYLDAHAGEPHAFGKEYC